MQVNKILEKLGLKYEDLREEERQVYHQWQDILTKPDVTIEDLKKFLPTELERLDRAIDRYDNTEKQDLYLKAVRRNLKMVQAFILGPEKRKEWLQNHLESRITGKHG